MGIRGLKKYLNAKLSEVVCPCVLPSNSTLVVDGDGWVFQLVETSLMFRPELGGCYVALDSSVSEEIARLRSCGLQLVVYFDGPCQRMKVHTAENRELQRQEQWKRFYDYCEASVKFTDDDSFPLPSLWYEQLIVTLKECGVDIVNCEGEADQEIAKAVCTGNAGRAVGEERFYAYGRDSDYVLMKGCPYIEFGTIEAIPVGEHPAPPTPATHSEEAPLRVRQSPSKAAQLRMRPQCVAQAARVWRRSEVSDALSVTEEQLVDWAVLVGNDYTGHLSRTADFDWSACIAEEGGEVTVANGYGASSLESLLDTVRSLGEQRLRAAPGPNAEAVQLAIDFSVAVYDLLPLERFPVDDECDDGSDGDSCDDPQLLPLCAELAGGIGGAVAPTDMMYWFRSSRQGGDGEVPRRTYFWDLARYVAAERLAVEEDRPRRRLSIGEHALAYLKGKVSVSAEVTPEHLLALEAMLRKIEEGAVAAEEQEEKSAGQQATELRQLAFSTPTVASAGKSKTRSAKKAGMSPAIVTQDSVGHSTPSNLPVPAETFRYRPRWKDVVAAHAYQSACALLHRYLPREAYRAKRNSPAALYNGVYFHSAMRALAQGPSPVKAGPELRGEPAAPVAGNSTARALLLNALTPGAVAPPSPAVATSPLPAAPGSAQNVPATVPVTTLAQDRLPIDAYREEILARIARDRVTIIHGETGCGKSSCLPRFLLEHAESCRPAQPCQIMVSQPRRIAVTSLLRRLRETLGRKVGMRMGHGIRDDFPETKIHYVTTGYLVRALAHQPERFQHCTHLIIDEVHERSVDGDLVCLLARDLLRSHPTLRVVLMSATIHTELYRNYFAAQDDGSYGDMECLSVGVRRFPVDITYPEDILQAPLAALRGDGRGGGGGGAAMFASQVAAACKELVSLTSGATADSGVSQKLAAAQYKAVVGLVRAVAEKGTGVLVFVSGINDITELVLLFEPFPTYLVFPIHSDIPADEQELAFGVTPPDKVKVVVATNAAESSVTIPDCDVVICLGTHKSLQYSALNHRTQLVNTWISKASATQRAGRTGRVRPGRVFRLYSKQLHAAMSEHEVAEVHRRPLQDVLLSMWVMLEDAVGFRGVTPFLQGLIEAPDMRNIEQSYQYLYESDLITHPSDEGFLTAVGRLSGELPVDITLGRMIAFGVMLGVAAEAVVLAAALSLPKAPFRYANSIHSDPEEYNAIVRSKFLTAAQFDGGAYSEPVMLLNLLRTWRTLSPGKAQGFCYRRGLLPAVMKQFRSMADHLAHTVSSRLRPAHRTSSQDPVIGLNDLQTPDARTLNLLRLILFWSSSGNVLRVKDRIQKKLKDVSVLVHSNEVTPEHMRAIFGADVPYKFQVRGKRVYDARLEYWRAEDYFLPLVQALKGLAAIGRDHGADCFWVVVKSERSQSTMVALVTPQGPRAEGVLGLLVKHVFLRDERLTSELGRQVADGIERSAGNALGAAVVLVVPDASKSEVKRLNDLHEMLEVNLSLLVPVVGNAKLTACNCCPSEGKLLELFFGGSDRGAGEEKNEHRRIACQVTNSRSVISFPDEDEDGTGAAADLEEGSSDGDSAGTSRTSSVAVKPLIDDLPLGHRLINCCQQLISCQQNKGKKRNRFLVLKKTPAAAANCGKLGGSAKKAAVPGSLRYAEQHLQQAAQNGEEEAGEGEAKVDEKLEVRLDCVCPTWLNIRGLKTTPAALNAEEQPTLSTISAILSRQTLLSCSFHRAPDCLFAVCHTALLLGAAGNLVVCEGVTFLPPGPSWMYIALLCAGADAAQLLQFCPDVAGELSVTPSQVQSAERVAELLRSASSIVPRPDIAQEVAAAFGMGAADEGSGDGDDWGEEGSGVSEEDNMAELLAGLTLEGGGEHEGHSPAGRRNRGQRGRGQRDRLREGFAAGPPSEVPLVVQQHLAALGMGGAAGAATAAGAVDVEQSLQLLHPGGQVKGQGSKAKDSKVAAPGKSAKKVGTKEEKAKAKAAKKAAKVDKRQGAEGKAAGLTPSQVVKKVKPKGGGKAGELA